MSNTPVGNNTKMKVEGRIYLLTLSFDILHCFDIQHYG